MASFAHLHVHTEYSLLDGMSQINDLVQHTVELGMDSLAITDHGAMYGVIEFYRACKANNVKPIIGLEAYLAPRGMYDRDSDLDRNYTHLLLIAENQQGYQNLLKIASSAQLEGFYYKPRIDHDFLAAHSEGLICTSGCMAAEIPQMLLEGREEEARRWLGWYDDIFGADRFYIELQEHEIPDLRKLNKALIELAPYANIPLLATNDVHYVRKEDADPHDILLCIGTGNLVSDKNRLRFSDNSYYMRSADEMASIFAEVPDAISNTLKVAEMCNVNLDDTSYKLPKFPVPAGFDAGGYLRHLCDQGLEWRYGERASVPEVRNRLEHELKIIGTMGFEAYFLIVWDLCEFARSRDIWWNVRGSGAGSVVAYSLGITNIDPLRNNLIFERFLNPGRVNMPDIDLDYPDDRRAEMIEYCVQKYGADKVAQIITFGTLGARAAIRDVGRTLDIPLSEVDQLARLIPAVPGKPVSIDKALEDVPDLKLAYEDKKRPYIKSLLDTARRLEGVSRHASTHAAGVLIADKPLVEYTPLNRTTQNAALSSMSQWPMEIVDSIGLLKVDFLGLRTLTIMRKACELIETYHGVHYDLNNIPYRHLENDDQHNRMLDEAFKLLIRGDTSGVFQVEGSGMTRVLTEMKPTRFEHIIAAISLFRPGPLEYIPTYIRRMHGEEPVTYHHDLLESILAETYGIIVYQEQIMQIASNLFGYELGDADLMRRAVAKKKAKELKKHRIRFQKEGPKLGISEGVAAQIFDDIEFFARYGFNKSHAADYAVLTVQTAFLKAHYPHEYMTALLTIERGDTDKVGSYINDCRRMGIKVLPPDINYSDHDFTIQTDNGVARDIRYGLSAIKNVGEGSVEEVLRARADSSFSDLSDFCQRSDLREVGKRAVESLIKVGALDAFGPRLNLLESLDRIMSYSSSLHKAADIGQMSLFGEATGVEVDTNGVGGVLIEEVQNPVPRREMLQWERDLVGVYVSSHPLQAVIDKIGRIVSVYSNGLEESHHDRSVTMAGTVTYIRPHMTKTGKPMAFAGLEDLYGNIEVVIWPSTWEETRELWEVDRILLVRGKVDAQRGDPKILCEDATTNFDLWMPTGNNTAPPELPYDDYDSYDDEPPPLDLMEAPMYDLPPNGGDGNNGQTSNNGYSSSAYNETTVPISAPIAPPPVPDTVIVEKPPEKPGPVLPSKMKKQVVSRQVRVSIERTGDPRRDKLKLQRIHGAFVSLPGNDKCSVVLFGGGNRVEIQFPGVKTNYSPELEEMLVKIVRPTAIEVV